MDTDTTAKSPLIGTTLNNKYKITAFLGQGGMSTVYKARHLGLGRDVAIKIMQEHLANEEGRLRFTREAQAAAALSHPNIVNVADFGESTTGEPYMVMDFLDGESLSDYLRKHGRCRAELALKVFRQVAGALQHAHDKGVLHRDLKPSNVMMVKNRRDNSIECKVVDLGLARFLPQFGSEQQRLTAAGELVGSPYYMSPEQIRDEELDSRSDIYAFGCLMYEALTGVRPFVDSSVITVLTMHLYEPPPPFSAVFSPNPVPYPVEALVLKCLDKSKDARPQSMKDLCRLLDAVQPWPELGPAGMNNYAGSPADLGSGLDTSASITGNITGSITGAYDGNSGYTLRLDQGSIPKAPPQTGLQKLIADLKLFFFELYKRIVQSFEGKGPEARRQRVTGTRVLVAVFSGSKETLALADQDLAKYQIYYKYTEKRKAINIQEFLVLLSTEQYDIVHLHAKFDTQGTFKDSTGFKVRLTDLKRACDYAKVKLLFLASDNNLDWLKGNMAVTAPSFHLILTSARGANFPKFLSTVLSRLARGETVLSAWSSEAVAHAPDKATCRLVPAQADISFLP